MPPSEKSPAGNVYDKYATPNPVARMLVTRFRCDLDELHALVAARSQLDIGCGEGVLVSDWAQAHPGCRFVGLDVEDDSLQAQWRMRAGANLTFTTGDAEKPLPYSAGEFELVSAIEVLEHLRDPAAAAREMARVAQGGHLLLSVPREPIWSWLNLARGAYWDRLGCTPGHIQRWSRRGFLRFASELGEVVAVRSPLPWTIVLVRV